MAITPTILTGDAATAATQGIEAKRRKIDMRDRIYLLEPSVTPLSLLLNKMGRGVAKSPRHEWLEAAATPTTETLAAQVINTATTFEPPNPSYYPVHSVFRHQAPGEPCLVTANDGSTLTITRAYGGGTAATWATSSSLTILGGAAREGDDSESSRSTKKVPQYNFTQIFRDPFGGSATLQKSDLYGPDFLAQEAMERGIEHQKYIELAMFFGKRNGDSSFAGTWDDEATPRRTMGGIDEIITTNTDSFSTITLLQIFNFAEGVFRYGSDTKMWFLALGESSILSSIATNALQVVPPAGTYGINIKQLVTPHGVFNVVAHKLFEGASYSQYGFALDLKYLEYVVLNGRDTTLFTNIQAPDVDGQKNEYLTECTLLRQFEEAHGRSTNMGA